MNDYSDVHPALEREFQAGVQTERDRCKALTKILTPETRLIVVKAMQKGLELNDVLDECLAVLKATPPATRTETLTQAVQRKFTNPGQGNGHKGLRPPPVT